jgi:HlyD family secretion protein
MQVEQQTTQKPVELAAPHAADQSVQGKALSPQALPATHGDTQRFFRWRLLAAGLAGLALAIGGGYWWLHRVPPLPAAIVYGNGRIEADPIDIATKFSGRIAELRVDEGAKVAAGQVPR